MDEEGGGELIGLREAGPIKKGEEGGCWAGLREAGPVEGREEDVYGIGVWGSGLRLAGADWSWAGPVAMGEEGRDWMETGLREASPVGEREDGD